MTQAQRFNICIYCDENTLTIDDRGSMCKQCRIEGRSIEVNPWRDYSSERGS
jgi:hypothetical protein